MGWGVSISAREQAQAKQIAKLQVRCRYGCKVRLSADPGLSLPSRSQPATGAAATSTGGTGDDQPVSRTASVTPAIGATAAAAVASAAAAIATAASGTAGAGARSGMQNVVVQPSTLTLQQIRWATGSSSLLEASDDGQFFFPVMGDGCVKDQTPQDGVWVAADGPGRCTAIFGWGSAARTTHEQSCPHRHVPWCSSRSGLSVAQAAAEAAKGELAAEEVEQQRLAREHSERQAGHVGRSQLQKAGTPDSPRRTPSNAATPV